MTDRLIKVREQGRLVLRGLKHFQDGARLEADRDETLTITVDWSEWLGSATISSVTNESNNASITTASNDTTTATLTVTGRGGMIEHRITTSSDETKELRIYVNASAHARADLGIA